MYLNRQADGSVETNFGFQTQNNYGLQFNKDVSVRVIINLHKVIVIPHMFYAIIVRTIVFRKDVVHQFSDIKTQTDY